ncbi:MAG: twin-arginine translocase TatA/TatE family subunit [Dehalococcoidia bacterium]
MPFHIGPMELVIVLVIILVLFGVGRLPEIGGAMGKAIRGFRKSVASEDEEQELQSPQRKVSSNHSRLIE